MKRNVFDILRRSFDSMLVNWPLIGIRVGEAFVLMLIVILTAIAVLVPILVSIGIEIRKIQTPDDMENAMLVFFEHWPLLLWILLAVVVYFLIAVALHSFVEAGSARVYVDAERIAGPANQGPRSRFRVFSAQRWWAGARDGWWPVFWIYNLAWSVAGLILLIPLIPTAGLMFLFRGEPGVMIGSGCVGLVLTACVGFVVAVITAMWSNRAITEWAAHRFGASMALSQAWRALKSDLGRHILIALAMFVISMAGASVFSSFSMFAAIGDSMHRGDIVNFFTMPIRLVGTFLNTIFSAAVAGWYLAAYSSLSTE